MKSNQPILNPWREKGTGQTLVENVPTANFLIPKKLSTRVDRIHSGSAMRLIVSNYNDFGKGVH